jgi:hypothetical protein
MYEPHPPPAKSELLMNDLQCYRMRCWSFSVLAAKTNFTF